MAKQERRQRGPNRSRDMVVTKEIIKKLYNNNKLGLSDDERKAFLSEIGTEYKNFDVEKFNNIINELCDNSLPIKHIKGNNPQLIWKGLFYNQPVGHRMFLYTKSKERLANKLVDVLEVKRKKILFLAAGTSIFFISRAILKNNDRLHINEIYTNNIYVFNELCLHGSGINTSILEGSVVHRDGLISCPKKFQSVHEKIFDAVITCFVGISYENGFSSDHEDDGAEKLMNMTHKNAKDIFIVINWEKFGDDYKPLVKIEDLLDDHTYYIITDPPEIWRKVEEETVTISDIEKWPEEEKEKYEEYLKWKDLIKKGTIKFIFAYRD